MTGSGDTDDSRRGVYTGRVLASRYRVGARLGQGGMGEVYEAFHLELPRRFAVKLLRGEHADQTVLRTRFRREAEAAASLSSEHIVQVFDYGHSDEGAPYLVMELLDGMDLRRFLDEQGSVSPQRAVEIIREACEGARLAHAQGIVHRDLKPENLFLARQGDRSRVKLLDFGIAKLRDHTTEQGNGKILGTPSYMPPEQVRGELTDQRADVYALGVILFELLTGGLPHPGEGQHEILSHVLFKAPRPLEELNPCIPAALAQITHKAIASKADDRFQSVRDFMQALSCFGSAERVGDGQPIPVPGRVAERPDANSPTVPVRDSETSLHSSLARPRARFDRAPEPPTQEPSPRPRILGAWGRSRRGLVLALVASAALIWFARFQRRLLAAGPQQLRSTSSTSASGASLAQQAPRQATRDVRSGDTPSAIAELHPDGGRPPSTDGVSNVRSEGSVASPRKDASPRPISARAPAGALRLAAAHKRAAKALGRPTATPVNAPALASSPELTHIEIKQGQQTLLFKRDNPLRRGGP